VELFANENFPLAASNRTLMVVKFFEELWRNARDVILLGNRPENTVIRIEASMKQ
jgi:hypothetical protein